MSALHHAVIHQQEEAVAFLANAFSIDMLDHEEHTNGHTALHKAVLCANRDICISLVVRGANIYHKAYNGQSAQQLAISTGQHDLIAALLREFG